MSSGTKSDDGRQRLSERASGLIGQTLDGRFQILKAIGQGAMGTVYLAKQLSVDRHVAVKVLREDLSPTATSRFLREARIISSIQHPNIVQLFEFAHHPEQHLLYFAMEFIDGIRLSRLNKHGRLHPNLVIELGAQICSALAEAHAGGVVHRDLKPSNMFVVVAADGSVQLKVLDFGVAHTFESADSLTATGLLCGTPAYMAPEQAGGKPSTDAVDLYALGINLYEMLAGRRPFRGATPVQTAVQQIQAEAPSLRSFAQSNDVPLPLVTLCEDLLKKQPQDRPVSAIEVRGRLQQIRRELDWGPLVLAVEDDDVWARWARPALSDAGVSNEDWSRADPAADPALLPGTPGSNATTESSNSLPERQGGGWEAFNVTPSEAKPGHRPMPAEPQAATLLGTPLVGDVGSPPKPPVRPQPTKSRIKPKAAPKPELRDLAPDRPERRGTMVSDMPRRRVASADVVRFVVVAFCTFIVVAAAFLFVSSPESEYEGVQTQTVGGEPEAEPIEAPEAEKPAKKKRRKRPKKKRSDEPIDIFEDAPEDAPDRPPIIIEEAR